MPTTWPFEDRPVIDVTPSYTDTLLLLNRRVIACISFVNKVRVKLLFTNLTKMRCAVYNLAFSEFGNLYSLFARYFQQLRRVCETVTLKCFQSSS